MAEIKAPHGACSICGGALERGIGNNAQPVNGGRCCDRCDMEVVIPARAERIQQGLPPYAPRPHFECPCCFRPVQPEAPGRKVRVGDLIQCKECGATMMADPSGIWRGLTPMEWHGLKCLRPEKYRLIQQNVKQARGSNDETL